jgi:PAS domain S-box-containing protein
MTVLRAAAALETRIRVLVADDTPTVRLLLRRTLEASAAFEVVGEAADGREAVELTAALQPDVVLLDLAMPLMDGLEAIPVIRRQAPETRIVVLSGFTADRMAAQAMAFGATAYIEKRHRPDELLAHLYEACRIPLAPARAPSGDADRPDRPRPVEASARQANERFRLAFEHAPIGMALLSPQGRFVQVNQALCRMAGHSEADLLARTLADVTHPDDAEADAELRARLLRGETPTYQAESRLVRSDGRVLWALVSCSLVRDDAGQPSQLVAQLVDITEHKRAESELTRSNADLSEFAYLAAHELKSPLQAVSGFASLLERVYGETFDPPAREFVAWIVDGAGRMNVLIEDLLAYCRVGSADPVLEPVALDDVVAEALAQLHGELAARGADVTSAPLPVVAGDRVQVCQLLQNLLANALKFVPEGVSPRVQVSAERSHHGWSFTVADNGIGVAADDRERIFAMFERLHPRERYKGTGIGLAICKRIVEQRGGAIWVEPNGGGGSRFRFTVPDTAPSQLPAA